jgi:hypothetical protein
MKGFQDENGKGFFPKRREEDFRDFASPREKNVSMCDCFSWTPLE